MMTILEIQSDEALRRELFPAVAHGVYLANAGVCPLPRRVVDRINKYTQACLYSDQEDVVDAGLLDEIRESAAGLCGVQATEIALVGPTSTALSLIASGLPLQPGDNVLVYYEDYPSNVYPWMAMQKNGVEVRWIKVPQLGVIEWEHISPLIDHRTRLVALASCHFLAGWRIDIDDIGRRLRGMQILFSLDMIQTLGAFPTPLTHVDFAAADSHKWLLGPCAAGVMYVRKGIQESFTPPIHGWHNVRCPDFIAQPEIVYRHGALKYEAGSHNFLGLVGLHECFRMIEEFGMDQIAEDLASKRKYLSKELLNRGMHVLCADSPADRSGGMISFFRHDLDLPDVHRRLAEKRITVSLRRDRTHQTYLRLSPHYYNNHADFDLFFQALDPLI
jgi:selenocysteine lyase/cysteine desulfurase